MSTATDDEIQRLRDRIRELEGGESELDDDDVPTIDAGTVRLQAQLDALKDRLSEEERERQAEQTRKVKAQRVKKEVQQIAESLGIVDWEELLKSLGGASGSAFALAEDGSPMIVVGGRQISISEGLAEHPIAAKFLADAVPQVSRHDKHRKEKARLLEIERELEKLERTRSRLSGTYPDGVPARIVALKREKSSIERKISGADTPSPEAPKKRPDARLVLKLREIDREMETFRNKPRRSVSAIEQTSYRQLLAKRREILNQIEASK